MTARIPAPLLRIFLVGLSSLLAPAAPSSIRLSGQEPPAGRAPDPAAQAVERGDRLEGDGHYRESIAIYEGVRQGHEDQVLWRIARAYSDMGESAPKEQSEALYDHAVQVARLAVEKAPGRADSHAMLAVALGKKALFAGGQKKVDLSKEIKSEADRAIALDPGNFAPYLVLGIWNREIANLNGLLKAAARVLYGGLPPASNERSVELLQKTIALNPASVRAHYELALTFREMGRKDEARAELRKVLEMPRVGVLDEKTKSDARKALESL